MNVFEMIEKQQEGKENTLGWCVGETLKAICAADPSCAQIVAEDLQNKNMSIHKCAEKNKENADRIHREQKGNFVYVPPEEEERIIREFYGLPERPDPRLTVLRPEEPERIAESEQLFGMDDDFDLFSL